LAELIQANGPRKGKKALIRMTEQEKVEINTKKMKNQIKKKEATISCMEKSLKSMKKDKINIEKKLRRNLINEVEEANPSTIIQHEKIDEESSRPVQKKYIKNLFTLLNSNFRRVKLNGIEEINLLTQKSFSNLSMVTPINKEGIVEELGENLLLNVGSASNQNLLKNQFYTAENIQKD
jgi:hypothetical protein